MTSEPDDGGLRNTFYRKVTRSGRTMTPVRRLLYRVAVPLAIGIIRGWWRAVRVVTVRGAQHLDAALAKAPSLVPCYWHQHQLYLREVPPRAARAPQGRLADQPVGGW